MDNDAIGLSPGMDWRHKIESRTRRYLEDHGILTYMYGQHAILTPLSGLH